MITSAYSKSSNSSGFNPILQKFYEMICEIIVSKTVCGIFLIFCRSSFIDNFIVKSNFSGTLKSPKLKYLKTHLFEKISTHHFEDNIWKNKPDQFFFEKIFFQGLGAFFVTAKPLIWASFFSTKNKFYSFFQVWSFNF